MKRRRLVMTDACSAQIKRALAPVWSVAWRAVGQVIRAAVPDVPSWMRWARPLGIWRTCCYAVAHRLRRKIDIPLQRTFPRERPT